MTYATHSPQPTTRRSGYSPFAREPQQRGWAQRSNSPAAAALVLGSALAFGGAGAAAAPLAAASAMRADEHFEDAVRLYERGHWEQSFENLAALADHGHVRAAKLALLMLRYGAPLYGTTFAAKPQQVARWAQRVLRTSSRATASPSSMTARA
jgi:hypothetical protein